MVAGTEFSLIRHYFLRPAHSAVLGMGDDAALLQPSAGQLLAVSTDTLVSGVHFFADADAHLLGWKALAVNLSDLAAMGAVPRWATLALTLPAIDEGWLSAFAAGWHECAQQAGIDLIGGDTTQGPLTLTVTVLGEVPAGQALRRDAACAGDDIWVSGTLGDAALALAVLQDRLQADLADRAVLTGRLHQPQARLTLGVALRGLAHAAIDISDGLLADLGHILERSGVGATIEFAHVPVSPAAARFALHPLYAGCVLAGGDDYELCFTAPAAAATTIEALSGRLGVALKRIGRIEVQPGLRVLDAAGRTMQTGRMGYEHFAA